MSCLSKEAFLTEQSAVTPDREFRPEEINSELLGVSDWIQPADIKLHNLLQPKCHTVRVKTPNTLRKFRAQLDLVIDSNLTFRDYGLGLPISAPKVGSLSLCRASDNDGEYGSTLT